MYETLDALAAATGKKFLLTTLIPVPDERLADFARKWPELPSSYMAFLSERGAGGMEDGFHFILLDMPLDAATEVFRDDAIYEMGAHGPVIIFGTSSSGDSYGFDLGDNARLVAISSDRAVATLDLDFDEFIRAVISMHPQLPTTKES